jgi:hypothetical protein
MDKNPREFSSEDQETLRDLGEMVERELKSKAKPKVSPPD